MENIREPKRMNIRVSAEIHDWLEKRSLESGIAKSSIVAFALEDYRKTQETVTNMPQLTSAMELLEREDIKSFLSEKMQKEQ